MRIATSPETRTHARRASQEVLVQLHATTVLENDDRLVVIRILVFEFPRRVIPVRIHSPLSGHAIAVLLLSTSRERQSSLALRQVVAVMSKNSNTQKVELRTACSVLLPADWTAA